MRKVILILLIVMIMFSLYPSKNFTSAVTVTAIPDPDPLTQSNLNGATISLTLDGDSYNSSLSPDDFALNNEPNITRIEKVSRLNDTEVLLTLSFNGENFGDDIPDFSINIESSATTSGSNHHSNYLTILSEDGETPQMYGTPDPDPLKETNLDGATITFTNPYYDFKAGYAEDFELINAPNGLTVASYSRINNRTGQITLAFDGTGFDTNYEDFYVRVEGGDTITGGSGAFMISNKIPIYPVFVDPVSITATTNPIELYENTLDGSIINATLDADAFATDVTANDIELNNAPKGLAVSHVLRDSDSVVRVFLSFDGTTFGSEITNFSMTVLSSGLQSAPSATSNSMTIKPVHEIAGLGTYIANGEAHPTDIEITGYNTKETELYLNIELYTETSLADHTVTFNYFVKVYDQSGTEIGNYGDIESTHSVAAPVGLQSVTVNNVLVPLSTDLPAGHRIVVIVKSVDMN